MDDPTLLEQVAALLGRILTTARKEPDWFIYVLGLLPVLGGVLWRWLLPRLRLSPLITPIDPSFPFEVIKPRNDGVLKTLMGSDQADDDPLADFNIPYQQRQSDLLTQEQLGGLLDVHRWLLILGRTGLGKTREAAELAQRLSGEGWTVLKLKNAEQLVVPTKFPVAMVGEQPRLLFFLDNLNQAMALGNVAIERATGEALPSALKQPLQERLKDTLEFFEQSCGTDRVRVIATARNETLPEKDDQPSEWDKLAVDRYPAFWKQFHHHELPVPEEDAVAAVLAETTQQANLPSVAEDFIAIARRNDGTFRNLVENLERAKNQGLTVSTKTYKDTLRGTWQSRYQAALKRYPAAKYLYDAVDLLRQCKVELDVLTVLPTAALLAHHTQPWHLWQRYILRRSLHQLNATERILQPRDGQIEAKGYTIDAEEYLAQVGKLLLQLAKQQPNRLENSLWDFVIAAADKGRYQEALRVNTQLIKLQPNHVVWYNQAWLKGTLENEAAAIAAYDQALALKPDYHEALNNKGVALFDLGQPDAAVAVYDQALTIKPGDHEALNNKGVALFDLGQYEAVVATYDQVLAIQPNYHQALNNKGVALTNLGQYEAAIATYDQVLRIKPDYHQASYNKGVALDALGQYEVAIAAYNQALTIKPDYYEALNNKGVVLFALGHYKSAIAAYDQALTIKPDHPKALNNKGNTLYTLGRYIDAIGCCDQLLAIQPDYSAAWGIRGMALASLGRLQEALSSYDKVLEIQPNHSYAIYKKISCYGLQGDIENAIDCLQKAIALDPTYRTMAKTDTDFDPIRHDERFRALVEGEPLG